MRHGVIVARKKFEVWWPTRCFEREIRNHPDGQNSADVFNDTQKKWILDAELAAQFAVATHARRVRLVPQPLERPDFEMLLRNGQLMRVEATEAMMEGRRRGDEYRAAKAAGYPISHDPGECWGTRRAAIAERVKCVAAKKAAKDYPPGTSLLIYVNITTHGRWRAEIENEIVESTRIARERFLSIWVLWDRRFYRCWPTPSIGLKH